MIAAALVVATLITAAFGFARDERELAASREDVARSASGALEASLRGSVDRTMTVAGLYEASLEVSRPEFARFTAPLLRTSNASALTWIERVTASRRRGFERRVGAPIVRLAADGRLVRQRARSEYDVVVQVAQRRPTRSIRGLDAGGDPVRAGTLSAARAAGAPRSTPILRIAGSLKPGTIVYVPVFDRRTGALRGFASGSYRVDRLDADIRAVVPAGTGVRLIQGPTTAVRRGDLSGAVRQSVDVAGRRWDLAVNGPGRSGLGHGPASLLIGLPLSALLAVAVLLLTRRTRQTEAIAKRRTSERDAAQLEHRASEQRLTTAFEEAPIGMAMLDFEGNFVRVNRALAEITGYAAERLARTRLAALVPADDQGDIAVALVAASTDAFAPFTVEHAVIRASGELRTVAVHVTRLNTIDGRPELVLAQVLDITERARGEAALEASEHQLRQILETAHDAFVAMDASGRITDWNPQAEAIFGWPPEAAIGRLLADTIIPERLREAHCRGLERFLETGEATILGLRLEVTGMRRGGQEFPVELTISPAAGSGGYSFNAFLRDVSERKRTEEELAAAHAAAIESSRLKSEFVANMSHEIRTPLNGMLGMTQLLLETELSPEQHEFARTVARSGDALLEVINDVLDFSKIEAGRLELDEHDFDLHEAVEDSVELLAPATLEKGLELVGRIDGGVPERVRGDRGRLRQVLTNLVANAVKFTAEGRVGIDVRMVADAQGGDALLEIEVSDTGVGIERERIEQLFDPFTQADASTTRRFGGTGLGLTISRQLVELMDGSIEADSTPGAGSRFRVTLPLERPAQARVSRPYGIPDGLRVLVVDHSERSRTVTQDYLGEQGAHCTAGGSADEALALLRAGVDAGEPYELAVVDLHLPGGDGLALVDRIRRTPALRATRLVLLTSVGDRQVAAREAGVTHCLTKPVRRERLLRTAAEAVEAVEAVPTRTPQEDRPQALDLPARAARVLVAEDNSVNRRVVERVLARWPGLTVTAAENGREAVDQLDRGRFDLVLMDCQMPELDGYDATREIREREAGGARVPVIAMTANAMKGDRERCLEAGMDDYLAKPLRIGEVDAMLERWLPADGPPGR